MFLAVTPVYAANLKQRVPFRRPKKSRSAFTTRDLPDPPGPPRYINNCSGFFIAWRASILKALSCSVFKVHF